MSTWGSFLLDGVLPAPLYPETPNTTLRVSVEIETTLAFVPAVLNLGQVGRGDKISRRLQLTGKLAPSVVLGALSAVPHLDVALTQDHQGDRHYVNVVATVQNDAPMGGPIGSQVSVQTGNAKMPALRLSIRGQVVGTVFAKPQQAYARVGVGQKPAQLRFDVVGRSETRFEIISAKDNQGRVEPAVQILKPGQHYRITAAVPPNMEPGNARGAIAIRTDDRQMPVLQVPYTIIVPRATPVSAPGRRSAPAIR